MGQEHSWRRNNHTYHNMHNLKPNTKYKLISVTMAIPLEIGEAGMADGINEMLRESMMDYPDFLGDYNIDFSGDVRETDGDPEEGELFDPIGRCAEF